MPRTRSAASRQSWRDSLKPGRNGFAATGANYSIALYEDVNLSGLFALDSKSQRVRIWARIPLDDYWQRPQDRWFRRDDLTLVGNYLERTGFEATNRSALYFAIRAAARDYRYREDAGD